MLGVFSLNTRTREHDLEDEFGRFGKVEKVVIVYDGRVRFFHVSSAPHLWLTIFLHSRNLIVLVDSAS